MVVGRAMAGGLLAVLLATGGQFPAAAKPQPSPLLAQVTPGSVTGRLDENSQTLEEGQYFALHSYEGITGETVTFEVVSEDFDAFVEILSPTGESLGADDDQGEGTNARFTIELSETGIYQIKVGSALPGEGGNYSLQWRDSNEIDLALQRASQLEQQANELFEQGHYSEAESLVQKQIEILKQHLGDRDPAVGTGLLNIAVIYTSQGRYEEAMEAVQTSLEILQNYFNEQHPGLIQVRSYLVLLSELHGNNGPEFSSQQTQTTSNSLTGRLDESSQLEEGRYYAIHSYEGRAGETITFELVSNDFDAVVALVRPDGEQLGRDNDSGEGTNAQLTIELPHTGTYWILAVSFVPTETGDYTLSWRTATAADVAIQQFSDLNQQVGELYQAGRYREAIPLAQEALSIRQEQLGERHPDVATSLNNLALLYQAQGRYGEAEPLYQESLGVLREQLGERHPDVATSLNNLADLYQLQGRYGEAEPLYQDALAIRREQLGERHPDVATSLNNLAYLYQLQGRYGEAEPLYQESLGVLREQLGERHPDVATSLNNLADLYQLQGRYGEAEPLYQDALAIRREQLGERHPDVATSLNNLAYLYQLQGRYGEAEPLYQESLGVLREQLGERHPDVATSLNNLADLYQLQGRYGEAEPLYQDALAIRREQLGERHPDVATSLNNLAYLYQLQGRYGEAEPLYQESLGVLREQLGERHPDVATSLNNLALLYQAQGRYGEAEPLYQEFLAIYREQLGERHPDVATSLNNLAELYRVQGRYGEAEPLYQESLAIRREQLGERHPDVATSLNNLAGLYQAQGRYGEAEPLYQESLAILREQLGERHPAVATSLNNLALLYQAQGRYGEAEPLYQEFLAIYREQLGERHPAVATSLNNLAELYRVQGRYGEAEPLYQESLGVLREQLGERHPDVATSLNNLAELYRVQGRYGEAEPLYQESLAIRREQLGERHPDVATSLNTLALLYQAQGRYGEAEPLYQESLAILREQLGEHHPLMATSLNNLAGLYQTQDDWSQAVRYLQSGLAIEEVNLELNLSTLTEAQRQDYAVTLSGSTDATISISLQAATDVPEAIPLGLTTLLRRKGRLLESGTASRQRLRQNLTPADQATLDDLIGVQQQLATLTFNPPAELSPEDYRAQLEQLESKATDLEKTLAQRSAVFRVETEPVEIAKVQAQLPAQSVLVEYARYRPFDAKADRANQWGAPRYAAYLLFPDGRIEAVDLGDAAAIDAAVQSFTSLLQDRSTALQRATLDRVADPTITERTTQTIKTLVFDPIAPYLQGTEHLLISPDGQLNRLPFEALQPEAGGDYLVQQYQISYLNSGRDLLKLDVIEPSQNPAVILANPDYDVANFDAAPFDAAQGASELVTERSLSGAETNRRSADLSQIQVGRLPGTAAEAAAIRPLLPNATLLTAAAATENALKQVNAPRILHIATHGFFLPDATRVAAPTQVGEAAIATTTPTSIPVENPLLRAGLALAGFNPRRSGHEDGVLTALEAAQLNLFGTQLVVLSACETGLGDITNGEGVYGLRRAFALAGAETQLMSLWQVSDDGTQRLMTRYYENLMAGMGRSEALRAVQLEAIEAGAEYSHPYYWSAFILAGDWSPLER